MENYLLPKLLEQFISFLEHQGKSKFTIVAYKKDLEQFIGFLTTKEKTDIREIKKDDIETFISKLITEQYTKKSASRKLNSIRTFFRYLKHEGVLDHNPAFDISHPKYTQSAPRILSKLEYRGLRDVAKEDERTYALVEVLLQTGIKIGELAELRVNDIKADTLHIRPYGKNIEREVPLNKVAKKAIEDYVKMRGNSIKEIIFLLHVLVIHYLLEIFVKLLTVVSKKLVSKMLLSTTCAIHLLLIS
jgi:site-specific recombinase XerD